MAVRRYISKQCGRCYFTTDNYSSLFGEVKCPRCGSSNFKVESQEAYDEKIRQKDRDEQNYKDRHWDNDSGDSM
jgi:phage FluMu protein Com